MTGDRFVNYLQIRGIILLLKEKRKEIHPSYSSFFHFSNKRSTDRIIDLGTDGSKDCACGV